MYALWIHGSLQAYLQAEHDNLPKHFYLCRLYKVTLKLKQMDKIAELKALVETAEKEGALFYEKNNKAAGTRLRNALQQIKTLATDLRKDVTEKKNADK